MRAAIVVDLPCHRMRMPSKLRDTVLMRKTCNVFRAHECNVAYACFLKMSAKRVMLILNTHFDQMRKVNAQHTALKLYIDSRNVNARQRMLPTSTSSKPTDEPIEADGLKNV